MAPKRVSDDEGAQKAAEVPEVAKGPGNIMKILGAVKRRAKEKGNEETPKKRAKAAAADAQSEATPKANAAAAEKTPAKAAAAAKSDPTPKKVQRQKAQALATSAAPPQEGAAPQQEGTSKSSADSGSRIQKGRGKGAALKKEEPEHDEGERVLYNELTLNDKRKYRSQFDRTVAAGDSRTEEKRRNGVSHEARKLLSGSCCRCKLSLGRKNHGSRGGTKQRRGRLCFFKRSTSKKRKSNKEKCSRG